MGLYPPLPVGVLRSGTEKLPPSSLLNLRDTWRGGRDGAQSACMCMPLGRRFLALLSIIRSGVRQDLTKREHFV